MRSLLALVAAVAALAAGWYVVELIPHDASAAASMAPVAAHPQEIRSVRLDGARLPLTTLGALLHTRVGGSLDAAALETDRQAMRDALMARGYWAADVGTADVQFGRDGGAHVRFRVEPGVVFHVRDVTIAGEPGAAALVPALTLAHGDDISPERLARNVELLATYLARHGRPGAVVTVTTVTDRAALAVDVRFDVRRAASR